MFKKISAIIAVMAFLTFGYAAKTQQMPPAAVNVVTAKTAIWQKTIVSTGTLVSDQGITIKSDISGRITQMFFKSGSYVKEGENILQIFPDILQAQLEQDQANLALTKLTYDRYVNLYKKQAVSASDYDTAASNYKVALATVAQTQAQLDQTLIKAPFNGYLGIEQVNVGDYLSAGDPIVNIEDTDPMFTDFSVPEVYSKKVLRGQKIAVTSPAYGKRIFVGEVAAIESLIDPNTRTLQIRASIPNKANILVPGSFVIVKLFIGEPKPLISLPQTAIVYSPQGDYVYVVKDNKAVKTMVKLGERGEVNIFITSGLSVGDIVVSEGQQRLSDGSAVQIEPGQ